MTGEVALMLWRDNADANGTVPILQHLLQNQTDNIKLGVVCSI
jgi:hypothetical protein